MSEYADATAPGGRAGVSFADIEAARARIADAVEFTPCAWSSALSELTGCQVYCKLDYLQPTGSFKDRGACNALMQLDEQQRQLGVIAASAGNHARALAYHGRRLGIPVTVVMPKFAPLIKVTTCKRLGAKVLTHGQTFAQARAKADELREAGGMSYIHGFDDPPIIAGQGTIGLEIVEQVGRIDAVVAPIGGGGLIAGMGMAIKHVHPEVEVIGVEADAAAGFTAALEAGRAVPVEFRPTLADGLAVGKVGDRAFAIARQCVDRVVRVSEDALALSILRLAELEKSVVEGAAAAPLAAMIEGHLPELAGKRVVLVLCGGNIDPAVLSRIIEHGMVVDGRLCRFTATISDRPGGLEHFAQVCAGAGASIKHILHDRAFAGPDVTRVKVSCVAETRDHEHVRELCGALNEAGFAVKHDEVTPVQP